MRYFVDSSALVKLFLIESQSVAMAKLVESVSVEALICSRLAVLEVRSAIRRKLLLGEISAAYASQALEQLDEEVSRWMILPIGERTFLQAASVIEEHALRSLDAIQLGSAVLIQTGDPITFVAYDKRLRDPDTSRHLAIGPHLSQDRRPRNPSSAIRKDVIAP